jgi:LPPG:FO 2-phospho-L-lactate transferase
MRTPANDLVLALSGGVGGAKLALGLSRVVPPGKLVVIANTGDDFEHLGLSISPDIDTLLYALAGIDNQETGWGRRDETWAFMAALEALGGETWFRLGDRDLAIHVERTRRLRAGEPLSRITAQFCRRLGLAARVLPMSDDPVRTRVRTPEGWLDFQQYFVRHRCMPRVVELSFAGVASANPHPDFLAAIADPALRAVVICPSNPFISIEPILAIPGVREALRACRAPVIGVAPIIGGRAVKGPTAKMMQELGLDVSAAAVACRYGDLLDAYVLDEADAASAAELSVPAISTRALMVTLADRERLARTVLAAADELSRR